MTDVNVVELLEAVGSAAQPFIVLSIIYLVKAWSRMDKSIDLLSQQLGDLSKRLERLENLFIGANKE